MKNLRIHTALAGFYLSFSLLGCQPTENATTDRAVEQDKKVVLDSDLQQASYLLGYQGAQRSSQQTRDTLDMDAFLLGATDFVAEADNRVKVEDRNRLMQVLQNAVAAKQAEASRSVRQAGDEYRAQYATRDGVVTLTSGMLYEVLTAGSGAKPGLADTVTTHYHGTMIDGTIFDSSVDRGQPASFPVGGVIAGWTEALQLMDVGSKWRLVIPPELAYGDRGSGAVIGPGSTLIFEVELLSIK